MDINVKVTLEAPSLIETLVALFSATGTHTNTMSAPVQAIPVTNNYIPAQVQQPTAPPTQSCQPAPAPVPQAPVVPVTPTAAYASPPSAPAAPQPVPVAQAPSYNIDTLANAAAGLMQAGKQQELVALLGQFGVQALTQLKPEQYGTFATALRQMGGKI